MKLLLDGDGDGRVVAVAVTVAVFAQRYGAVDSRHERIVVAGGIVFRDVPAELLPGVVAHKGLSRHDSRKSGPPCRYSR